MRHPGCQGSQRGQSFADDHLLLYLPAAFGFLLLGLPSLNFVIGLYDFVKKMFQFDGFHQVVKGTGFDPFNTVGSARLPGEQYHFGLRIRSSDVPQDFNAGHTRHFNIQYHHIHRFVLKNRQALLAISRLIGNQTSSRQTFGQRLAKFIFIVDQKQTDGDKFFRAANVLHTSPKIFHHIDTTRTNTMSKTGVATTPAFVRSDALKYR